MTDNLLMFLHMVPLFHSFRYQDLIDLSSKLKPKEFFKGDVLIEEGKSGGEALYIVESGHLSVQGKEGDEIIATLAEHDFFGEVSLLTGEPHSATIKALTDGKLLVLEKNDFEELEKNNPSVAIWLSKSLSYKLRSVVDGKIHAEKKVKIILVVSALSKGGTSVLSANLAASIVKQTGAKTMLLDLNLRPGSASTILKAIPGKSVNDLFLEKETFEFGELQEIACSHAAGFKVLSVGREEDVDPRIFQQLKQAVNKRYDYVVADVSLHNISAIEKIFEFGDQILFMVPDIKEAAHQSLQFLEDLVKIDPKIKEKVLIGGVCKSQANPQRVKGDFDFYLQFEEEPLENFLISGNPFVLTHLHAKISKKIDGLARRVCGCRIGLALSAGMAPGLAHIGVLKVFEKENVPVDFLAGTSGGAIYGSAFAAGVPMEKVENILQKQLGKILLSCMDISIFPYSGLINGNLLKRFFAKIIGNKQFVDLELPFKVVSVDLNSGETVILDKGMVGDALRASFSIPGIFSPYRFQGRYLLDGATVSPVPVHILYQSGADIVAAVNVNTNPLLAEEEKKRQKSSSWLGRARELIHTPFILDVMMRARNMTTYRLAEFDAAKADLIIHPRVERFDWRDYGNSKAIIAEGEKAAYEAIPRIQNLLKR